MNDFDAFWNIRLFAVSEENIITLGDTLTVLLTLLFGYLLIHLLQYILVRRLESSHLKPEAVIIIKRVSFYLIFLLVSLTVLAILGIPITVFAFATGALALGIGFGAQNIINNFISGWILIAERPIKVMDFIEIDGVLGTVQQVGTRSTRIHRTDGVHMLVPNSKLLENTVVNWTLVDQKVRSFVRVGVAYGTDPALVTKILNEIVPAHKSILSEPRPEFIFEDFGDSALIFDSYFWCEVNGEKSLRAIRSEIRHQIASRFDEAGIVIAFPQRDLHLHTQTPLQVSINNTEVNRD